MAKICAKFHKHWYKIVWGVVLTRYLLSIHFHRIWGQKMTKFTKWKMWQKLIQGLYPNHMHITWPWGKHVQSFKKIGMKLYEELGSQGTHCHNTSIESEVRKLQSLLSGKSDKINAKITSNHMHIFKPWRKQVQSLKKIGIKLYAELRSQGTHCLYNEVEKCSQSGKSDKK